MTDIVERLRWRKGAVFKDAADEIERLRRVLQKIADECPKQPCAYCFDVSTLAKMALQ